SAEKAVSHHCNGTEHSQSMVNAAASTPARAQGTPAQDLYDLCPRHRFGRMSDGGISHEKCSLCTVEFSTTGARCLWVRSTSTIDGDPNSDSDPGDHADPDYPTCSFTSGAISYLRPCAAQRTALRSGEHDGDLFTYVTYNESYLGGERHPSAPGCIRLSGLGLRFSWQWGLSWPGKFFNTGR